MFEAVIAVATTMLIVAVLKFTKALDPVAGYVVYRSPLRRVFKVVNRTVRALVGERCRAWIDQANTRRIKGSEAYQRQMDKAEAEGKRDPGRNGKVHPSTD